ncbi:MAG: protein kinase, partial [Erysipelotrichaceae bacterium]|nr:protein kinase [Erysipelotrichaceae bacterium]
KCGYTIYIRMELLQSLDNYMRTYGHLKVQDVVKIGIDICTALENCEKAKIIHRDIKPANIFVSKYGNFKLGDFGISRNMENETNSMSQKGTPNYMAPEVYRGEKNYDNTVDIYSLGITLYRLLNNFRLPFQPSLGALLPEDTENATYARFRGKRLLPPVSADETLSKIILKACEFRPENRYQSASMMKADLASYLNRYDSAKKEKIINCSITEKMAKNGVGGDITIDGATFNIQIPSGTRNGTSLNLRGKGNIKIHILNFNEERNDDVIANGRDISETMTITPKEAKQGVQKSIVINGKKRQVGIPARTRNNDILKLDGFGERGINGGRDGDLLVTVHVKKESNAPLLIGLIAVVVIGLGVFVGNQFFREVKDNNVAGSVKAYSGKQMIVLNDTIEFGNYEQDNNASTKNEPIIWRVISVDNGEALLICDQVIDSLTFNDGSYTSNEVLWKDSYLRNWLNKDFYNGAFSPEEKECIIPVNGDNVFVMSYDNLIRYLQDYKVVPTAFAKAKGVYVSSSDNCGYWLSSPGKYPNYAAYVRYDGVAFAEGISVSEQKIGVRPVIRIKIVSYIISAHYFKAF